MRWAATTGRFIVLMPETNIPDAMRALAHLQDDIAEVQTGLGAFGADGDTFDNMYADARQALGNPPNRPRSSRIRDHNFTQR